MISWPGPDFPGKTFTPAPEIQGASAIASGSSFGLALVSETAPRFATQVARRSGVTGLPLAIYAPATGEFPMTYQWFRETEELTGETNVILRISRMDAGKAGAYKVVAKNGRGVAEQSFEILAIPIGLTEAPYDQIAWIGGAAKFAVRAAGEGLRYQWLHDGKEIPGQTNAFLSVTNLDWSDDGLYSSVIRSGEASMVSPAAKLTVKPIAWWGIAYPFEGLGEWRDFFAPVTNIAVISQNSTYNLVLQKDGVLRTWGVLIPPPPFSVPTPTSGIVALAPRGAPVSVTRQGRVLLWASDAWSAVPDLQNVIAVSDDLLVLRGDGTLRSGTTNSVVLALTNIASFSSVFGMGAAVSFKGEVFTWPTNQHVIDRLKGITNAVAVSASRSHLLVLGADGAVTPVAWFPQFYSSLEVVPPGLNNVIAVFAGDSQSFALLWDGSLVRWSALPQRDAAA